MMTELAPQEVVSHDEINRLIQGNYHDPHRILGLHTTKNGAKVIRLWRPGAQTAHLEVRGGIVQARRIHPDGLFEYVTDRETTYLDYRVYHASGLLAADPYAFLPSVSDMDAFLFGKGTHYTLFEVLGAHPVEHYGVQGTKFALWAPSAARISLVSDFNHWNGVANPMRSMGSSGIWELFVPGIFAGEKYKFEIKTHSGQLIIKSDPYAHSFEKRPLTASVVADVNRFTWSDSEWLCKRSRESFRTSPMCIYEVHLGSWKRKAGQYLNYRELASELAPYCKEMGFTHIELMPIQEHPLDQSWGYQVTGYYAVTSRHGTPEDFQYFVNEMHKQGIGVILDWVPGHFPTDDFSLARFDGTALYEHDDPRQGFHPHWHTHIFNFGRHEVSNFLIASALFWVGKMHIDGIRVDAVASMLYLDYGRQDGEWIPNRYGGKENVEAIEFLRHFNSILHHYHPGALTIAEESTSFGGVSHPVENYGLGFDMKWNMGWMNDTLRYISKDPIYRSHHHNDLTFGLLYAFAEKFVLVLSHDEVVHGKGSLMGKMPGDYWQQFANMRLLYTYMMCMPGKSLLFQGAEIGQWDEWNCDGETHWFLQSFPIHAGLQTCVKEMNHFYLGKRCLWERDFDWTGFEWVDFADYKNSVISYYRKGSDGLLLCVHNFTPQCHPSYFLPVRNAKSLREVFNSDAVKYGGSGKSCPHPDIVRDGSGYSYGVNIGLAPLATMIFEVDFYP